MSAGRVMKAMDKITIFTCKKNGQRPQERVEGATSSKVQLWLHLFDFYYNRYRLNTNYNRAILNYEIKLVKNYRLKLTLGRVIKVTDKNNYLHVLKKRVKKRG